MAFSAHKNSEMMNEIEEDSDSLSLKAKTIAELLKSSNHAIAFTGAGISTSAGIPDFRGPEGVWTLKAEGRERKGPTTSTIKAVPTLTHMAILKLLDEGYIKFLVSQNTDGLHRRSGVTPDKIAELHGNSNLEKCRKCSAQYLRDYITRSTTKDHKTGRYCNKCGEELYDSIINFGESLPSRELNLAFEHGEKADFCLTLGSSLTVAPAASVPKKVGKKNYRGDKSKHLVICNLQKTPLDSYSDIRVHSKTDNLMELVMKELNLEIPEWRLNRQVSVNQTVQDNKTVLTVAGVDVDDTPVTLFQQVEFQFGTQKGLADSEPFQIRLSSVSNPVDIGIKLSFFGHYNEPDFLLPYTLLPQEKTTQTYRLSYNPFQRQWNYSGNPSSSQFE